jgi:uncharacterized membrane protein HdeD (DUF308 family)
MATNIYASQQTSFTALSPLRAHWRVFLFEGIVLIILGLAAIVVPPIATLAVETVLGWLLLASGAVGLISTFSMRRAPGFGWALFSALLGIAAGVVLIGVLTLTVVLTAFLVIEGCVSIMYAFEHRRGASGRWGMMLVSGVIDLILAAIIFAGLPGTAAWAIGLLLGVNLVFGGATLIAMALHARGPAAGLLAR